MTDHDEDMPVAILHVAPHPSGGWMVEPADRRFAPQRHLELDKAVEAASTLAASNARWQVIVHDPSHPVAPSAREMVGAVADIVLTGAA